MTRIKDMLSIGVKQLIRKEKTKTDRQIYWPSDKQINIQNAIIIEEYYTYNTVNIYGCCSVVLGQNEEKPL